MPHPKILLITLILVSFIACKKNENSVSLPLSSSLNVYYSDTFSINLSSVLIDCVETNTSPRLLAGHYTDPYVGNVTANSYFQFSLKGDAPVSFAYTYPVFDSISLLLVNDYYYGDTLKPYTIKVNQVKEPIELQEGTGQLYNNSGFTVDPDILGSTSFSTPPSNDSLSIPLKKSFGREIFNMAVLLDERVSKTDNFKIFFNGISISASNPDNNVIYGFSPLPVIRMYYHDSLATAAHTYYDFAHIRGDIHSNRILNDRKNVPGLNELKEIYAQVSSAKMNNTAAMLTGINILAKIEFPYIKYLRSVSDENIIINRAQLVIYPKANSYNNDFPLPKELVLYTSDETNKLYSETTKSGITDLQSPVIDKEDNLKTKYTFDVTSFVNQQLRSEGNLSLLLGPYTLPKPRPNRAEKLILDQNNIKLIIYLTVM